MSDEAAFLAAIRARPDDDTARLVFADWLDEHRRQLDAALMRVLARPASDELRLAFADACAAQGDRLCVGKFLVLPESALGRRVESLYRLAEFVRVQVELAALGAYDYARAGGEEDMRCPSCGTATNTHKQGCRWLPLHIRERELWANGHGPNPEPPLSGTALSRGDVTYASLTGLVRRGFVEEIVAVAADWLAHGDALRERHPVRRVRLTSLDGLPIPALMSTQEMLEDRWPGIAFELPIAAALPPGSVEYNGHEPPTQNADGSWTVTHNFTVNVGE